LYIFVSHDMLQVLGAVMWGVPGPLERQACS
jgi:hypothetical protein